MSVCISPWITLCSVWMGCAQMRENYEVTSAIYIIRNDHRAHCFLDYWRRYACELVRYHVNVSYSECMNVV